MGRPETGRAARFDSTTSLGGGVNNIGPSILRTRHGDLQIYGPILSNMFLDEVKGAYNVLCGPSMHVSAPAAVTHYEYNFLSKCEEAPKRKRGRPKGAKSSKKNNTRTIPLLPPSKLMKHPTTWQKHPTWMPQRKVQDKGGRSSQQDNHQGSDPI
jgi:hypothetical protein